MDFNVTVNQPHHAFIFLSVQIPATLGPLEALEQAQLQLQQYSVWSGHSVEITGWLGVIDGLGQLQVNRSRQSQLWLYIKANPGAQAWVFLGTFNHGPSCIIEVTPTHQTANQEIF